MESTIPFLIPSCFKVAMVGGWTRRGFRAPFSSLPYNLSKRIQSQGPRKMTPQKRGHMFGPAPPRPPRPSLTHAHARPRPPSTAKATQEPDYSNTHHAHVSPRARAPQIPFTASQKANACARQHITTAPPELETGGGRTRALRGRPSGSESGPGTKTVRRIPRAEEKGDERTTSSLNRPRWTPASAKASPGINRRDCRIPNAA